MTPNEIENIYRNADSHVGGLGAVFRAGESWAVTKMQAALASASTALAPQAQPPQVATTKVQVQAPSTPPPAPQVTFGTAQPFGSAPLTIDQVAKLHGK